MLYTMYPFAQSISQAIVHRCMFDIDVISHFSSKQNYPPLSVIKASITPNCQTQCVIKVSTTWLGFLLSVNIDIVYLDHMTLKCNIP